MYVHNVPIVTVQQVFGLGQSMQCNILDSKEIDLNCSVQKNLLKAKKQVNWGSQTEVSWAVLTKTVLVG